MTALPQWGVEIRFYPERCGRPRSREWNIITGELRTHLKEAITGAIACTYLALKRTVVRINSVNVLACWAHYICNVPPGLSTCFWGSVCVDDDRRGSTQIDAVAPPCFVRPVVPLTDGTWERLVLVCAPVQQPVVLALLRGRGRTAFVCAAGVGSTGVTLLADCGCRLRWSQAVDALCEDGGTEGYHAKPVPSLGPRTRQPRIRLAAEHRCEVSCRSGHC